MAKQPRQPSMLEGPIWKGLIGFAIPIFFGHLFQQLYNTADTLIVGNFIGKEALAAVSSSANLIHMMIGLLQGIAMGAGVLIAKSYGAKDYEGLHRAVHTGLAVGLTGGLLLTAVGMTLTPTLLRWMDTPADVLPNSILYFRIYFLGATAQFTYNICVGILQNVGDSRHPLYYLILSSVVNVLLDLLFVAGLGWGVGAAALATVIAQFLSVTLCLRQLTHADGPWRVELRKIRFHLPSLKKFVQFGLPSGVQNSVISFANVVVQANINAFGSDAMAGCGSYTKIEGFAFLPVTCFAMGLSTFVGQNLGAKQYDRVRKGTRFGLSCALCLSVLIGVLIYTCSPVLIRMFNSEPAVVAYGVQQAHTVALFYFLMTLSHTIAGIMRGAGRATVPMTVMLVCWCVIRVTYITITVAIIPDIRVVFWAYPLTWTLSAATLLTYYLKADWIHHFDRLEQQRQG